VINLVQSLNKFCIFFRNRNRIRVTVEFIINVSLDSHVDVSLSQLVKEIYMVLQGIF